MTEFREKGPREEEIENERINKNFALLFPNYNLNYLPQFGKSSVHPGILMMDIFSYEIQLFKLRRSCLRNREILLRDDPVEASLATWEYRLTNPHIYINPEMLYKHGLEDMLGPNEIIGGAAIETFTFRNKKYPVFKVGILKENGAPKGYIWSRTLASSNVRTPEEIGLSNFALVGAT